MQWGFAHFAKRSYANTKRRPWLLRPSASLRATCGARSRRGQKQLATLRFAQTSFCPNPPGPPLLGASTRGGNRNTKQPKTKPRIPKTTRTRHGVSLFAFVFLVFCPRSRLPRPGWAEQRRRRRIRDRACLSRRRVCARPRRSRAAQVARSEA